MKNRTAYLSNLDNYTIFTFNDVTLKFLTSKNLKSYKTIKNWDKGYIVVDSILKDGNVCEDYIDLIPILENLYMNPKKFLRFIKNVELKDEQSIIKKNC